MADDLETPEAREEAESRALAKVDERAKAPLRADTGEVMGILPRTIEEAARYANGLIQAGQVPDAFRYTRKEAEKNRDLIEGAPNASLVMMGILKSMELGVPPQTGLAGLLPLNGRFTVWGDLAAALVQQSGKVTDHIDRRIGPSFDPDAPLGEWPLDYGYEISYWRAGQKSPYVGRFTVRDAKRPNLWMNQYRKPWLQYPDRMLFNRARAFSIRDGFADALCGLSIAEEVIDSLPPLEETTAAGTRHADALEEEPVEHQPEETSANGEE